MSADEGLRENNPGKWLSGCIESLNTASDLFLDLYAYAYAVYSTNTTDERGVNEINTLEEIGLPLKKGTTIFRNALVEIDDIQEVVSKTAALSDYVFFIEEELYFQKKQMLPEEEDLANDLSRSGGDAWSRLQEAVSSNLKTKWDDTTEKTVTGLRELAYNKDRNIRARAFEKELALWKKAEIPLAFALNGVKGSAVTLNTRRKYESALKRATRQARISDNTLNALILVMEESLPIFRRYLKKKAEVLKIGKCAFYDLFAPVGSSEKVWTYPESRKFIVRQFGRFSDDFALFADSAFENGWIDAKMREGKVGGAYCTSFPLSGTSGILCNFSGSFNSVTTLAHELGHGYHHHILRKASYIHRDYPMTLAETASIFSENIVFEGVLSESGDKEKAPVIEVFLQDTTQVIVDILSRFYFEREVFERRKSGELSAGEFCDLMISAQKKTYGDGLDEKHLHPYMWAVKGHYYSQDLGFYNFPYAFGQLFGLALFSIYRKEGKQFADKYREILSKTGKTSANVLIKEVGFDIETPDFWRDGISMIEEKVKEFEYYAKSIAP